jgi:predicted transcriptional regulator of viral defense system
MAAVTRLSHQALSLLRPTFTKAQAQAVGIAPYALYALRDAGSIVELSRGVYRDAAAPETIHLDLLAVALRAPAAVVCVESALALHQLIDDIPAEVSIAVPRGMRPPTITYPPVNVSRFDADTFHMGVERFEAAPGEFVPVYGPARSVVDVMRLRHLYGDSLALHALGRYLRASERRDITELMDLARALGVEGPVRTATEAVLA